MSLDAIRDAIVARMKTVAAIGRLHPYERYTRAQGDFRAFYETDGKILGWFVRLHSREERPVAAGVNEAVFRFRIQGFRSLDDDAATEIEFDNLVEAAISAFRDDETLGGAVDTTIVGDDAGLQREDSGPVMFAGILCHGVRLALNTQVTVETGAAALDDFETGGVEWDMAPPDETIDAEDTIEPEQDA